MADLFGAQAAAATIARTSSCTDAERLEGFGEAVRDLVAGVLAKHMDQTGFRIGGKTQRLHVVSTTFSPTFDRVALSAGKPVSEGRRDRRRSITGKPDYTMCKACLDALRNADPLARPEGSHRDREEKAWARKTQQRLRRACHAVNRARERDASGRSLDSSECSERRYDAIRPKGSSSMRPKHHWRAPCSREAANGAACASPTVQSSAPRSRYRIRCASFAIRPFLHIRPTTGA